MSEREFNLLYQRYAPMIYGKCFKILNNKEDALEATQEVAIKLLTHMDQFRKIEKQTAWIYRVATNTSLNILRSKKRQRYDTYENLEMFTGDHGFEASLLSRKQIEEILEKIPKKMHPVVVYHYLFGMTQEEIAEVLGKSRMTVIRWLKQVQSIVGKLA